MTIAIKNDTYTIYCKCRAEAEAAWKATQYQRKRAGRRKKDHVRERGAGAYLATLPETHGRVMALLDPDWLEHDWRRLERAVYGQIEVDVHVIQPGEWVLIREGQRMELPDQVVERSPEAVEEAYHALMQIRRQRQEIHALENRRRGELKRLHRRLV